MLLRVFVLGISVVLLVICTVVSVTSFMVWWFVVGMRPYKWLRPDLVPPAPFLQCQPHLTPGGLDFLLIWLGLMKNSERPGFPTFAVLGKGTPALEEFNLEVEGVATSVA